MWARRTLVPEQEDLLASLKMAQYLPIEYIWYKAFKAVLIVWKDQGALYLFMGLFPVFSVCLSLRLCRLSPLLYDPSVLAHGHSRFPFLYFPLSSLHFFVWHALIRFLWSFHHNLNTRHILRTFKVIGHNETGERYRSFAQHYQQEF